MHMSGATYKYFYFEKNCNPSQIFLRRYASEFRVFGRGLHLYVLVSRGTLAPYSTVVDLAKELRILLVEFSLISTIMQGYNNRDLINALSVYSIRTIQCCRVAMVEIEVSLLEWNSITLIDIRIATRDYEGLVSYLGLQYGHIGGEREIDDILMFNNSRRKSSRSSKHPKTMPILNANET
ncbi:hypothetical protein M9H77_22382 [Catharanthus roseus]|uniref:Uncharacterized protein n=1 Tax=Catharanthus roseus TaxID=4058 RepID=A0ACC0ASD6_CATRO|nr:hypothetical protein M9H77_22382 [Catharanthus roseus]